MNLTNKIEIKNLLKKYNARPEKYLGQHFILSKMALKKMVDAAEIKKSDVIVEIGPGIGTLTQELSRLGAEIIAIEKDPMMVSILKETIADYKNIKIIRADARYLLVSDTNKLGVGHQYDCRYKIVANLPYNIAAFLIRNWLEPPLSPRKAGLLRARPDLMVLMIQKEVAQRIAAKPPHSNILAISVQFHANVKIIGYVPKEMFWPRPKVDAAIIKIAPKAEIIPQKTQKAFFAAVKAGFSSPRKQLAGNFIKKFNIRKEKIFLIFKDLGIDIRTRAENLSLEQWQELAKKLIHK